MGEGSCCIHPGAAGLVLGHRDGGSNSSESSQSQETPRNTPRALKLCPPTPTPPGASIKGLSETDGQTDRQTSTAPACPGCERGVAVSHWPSAVPMDSHWTGPLPSAPTGTLTGLHWHLSLLGARFQSSVQGPLFTLRMGTNPKTRTCSLAFRSGVRPWPQGRTAWVRPWWSDSQGFSNTHPEFPFNSSMTLWLHPCSLEKKRPITHSGSRPRGPVRGDGAQESSPGQASRQQGQSFHLLPDAPMPGNLLSESGWRGSPERGGHCYSPPERSSVPDLHQER